MASDCRLERGRNRCREVVWAVGGPADRTETARKRTLVELLHPAHVVTEGIPGGPAVQVRALRAYGDSLVDFDTGHRFVHGAQYRLQGRGGRILTQGNG